MTGFAGGIDVRDEYTIGAKIEGLLDARAVVVSANADQRFCAATGNAAEHGGKLFVIHAAVLSVNEQSVVAAVCELFGDRRAVRIEEQSHFRVSRAQLLFKLGTGESGFCHG